MQLKVIKCDGTIEVYLHTKIMGTLAVALGESGCYQEGQTEHLAEAVTEYIAKRYGGPMVSTDEIHAMIEAVLSETGYYEAALALHEYRLTRQIKRSRTEVIYPQPVGREAYGAALPTEDTSFEEYTTAPWNKSVIVQHLEMKKELSKPMARAVAGAVEEKVLRLGMRRIFSSLVRALVANELWSMLQAETALLGKGDKEEEVYTGYTPVAVRDEAGEVEVAAKGR